MLSSKTIICITVTNTCIVLTIDQESHVYSLFDSDPGLEAGWMLMTLVYRWREVDVACLSLWDSSPGLGLQILSEPFPHPQ